MEANSVEFRRSFEDNQGLKRDMETVDKRLCTILLEEKIEDNFHPTEEELLEYASWLGMNMPQDMDLIWIARDGLTQPLPKEWKPCQTENDEIYYFNFETGESVWDHPCDGLYRKLYQDECKRLGKRPVIDNSKCSLNLQQQQQQLSNWGEETTQIRMAHQMGDDEMMNAREHHSEGRSTLQYCLDSERMPSKKEIQMNIVEKEIDNLKEIRAQLLRKMNTLWQEGGFSPMATQLLDDRIENCTAEMEQASILDGNKNKQPSLEIAHDHLSECLAQPFGQHWTNTELEEGGADPRRTQEGTEMLSKQLEMAKLIPVQKVGKVRGDKVHGQGSNKETYETEEQRDLTQMYAASKKTHQANEQYPHITEGQSILHRVREELKTQEQIIIDEMKEKILLQVKESMDAIRRSGYDEDYRRALMRKEDNVESLRRELRKDMEFQLLLEEETLLKRKRDNFLSMPQKQSEREDVLEHEGSDPTKRTHVGNDKDGDLKELILQCNKELRDDIAGLKIKMNEIIVSHADQLNVEAPTLRIVPAKDIGKAASDATQPLLDANSTTLLHILQESITELSANLRNLLQESKIATSKSFTSSIKELGYVDHQSKLPDQNLGTMSTSTDSLFILKEIIQVIDEELHKHTNHSMERYVKNQNWECSSSNIGDEILDAKVHNSTLSIETLFVLKILTSKLEEQLRGQVLQQRGSKDQALGSEPDMLEVPLPKQGLESHSLALNGDKYKKTLDVLDIVNQFKTISTEMISSLKGFICELNKEMKGRKQQQKRELQCELNELTHQHQKCGPSRQGNGILEGWQTLDNGDDSKKTLNITCGETISFERLSTKNLGMLEGFIGSLHQELRDHIFHQDGKAYNDTCIQKDLPPIPEHDVELHETSLQGDQPIYSFDDNYDILSSQNVSFSPVSSNTLCNLKGFIDDLHQETMSSTQHKNKKLEEGGSHFLVTSTIQDISRLHEANIDTRSVLPMGDSKVIMHDHILDFPTSSTNYTFLPLEKCENELETVIHGRPLHGGLQTNFASTTFKPESIDDITPSFPEGTKFETHDNLISPPINVKKVADTYSTSSDVIFLELRRLVTRVKEELEAIIKKCTGDSRHVYSKRSEMKGVDLHDFYSQSEECDPLAPILKTWSAEIEKSTENLLHRLKTHLMENMDKFPCEKTNKPSVLHIVDCDKLQPPKLPDNTQLHTLLVEEKRIWYDILNDATKQWLQKEWVERLEHQSDLTTTGDQSISPSSSEYMTQVQKVLGEEKKIMYDILNRSTEKWLMHQRNPLVSGRPHEVKDSVQDTITYPNGGTKDEHLPTSSENYCTLHNTSRGKSLERGPRFKGRSHTGDVILSYEKHGQSKLFTNDLEDVGCLPCNLNFFKSHFSLPKKYGYGLSQDVEEAQRDMKVVSTHKMLAREKSFPSMNEKSPILKPIGTPSKLNHNLGLLHESERTCEECSQQNKPRQQKPPGLSSCESYSYHPSTLSKSTIVKTAESNLEHNLFISGAMEEVKRGQITVPRSNSQLKLVTTNGWHVLQSKLRLAHAKVWAHIMAICALKQPCCRFILKIKDTSFSIYATTKFIKTVLRKMVCGEAYQSTKFEAFEEDVNGGHHEGIYIYDSREKILNNYNCYPCFKPCLTRSKKFKDEYQNTVSTAAVTQTFDKQNPSSKCEEDKYKFHKKKLFDRDGNETRLNDQDEFHINESLEDSFVKYQSDDDLALSIVENTQRDCQTPTTKGVNFREVDMHQLEEAINNLRNSRELEEKGKSLWVNHCNVSDNYFENGTKDSQDYVTEDYVKPALSYQRELDYIEPFVFANGYHLSDHMSFNGSKQEEPENGNLNERVPKFITFEILQQGEIAFPKIISTGN